MSSVAPPSGENLEQPEPDREQLRVMVSWPCPDLLSARHKGPHLILGIVHLQSAERNFIHNVLAETSEFHSRACFYIVSIIIGVITTNYTVISVLPKQQQQ